jgi:DTW domain-containing protein YfiP
MAELSIPNCRVIDSDQENYKEILQEFIDKYNPFMVFYTHETNDLKENIPNLPSKNFILLDGTWDKARKILFTNPVLQKLKMFHLNPVEETLYKPIRKACSEGFISTLEATKETLETLYPDKKISGLLSPLKYTVELQLKLRN